MSSKTLCLGVRFAAIIAAVCGVVLFCAINFTIAEEWTMSPSALTTWHIIVTLSALPCFGVLICMWAVSNAIANDTVFTVKTSKWIERGALLLFADAGFVFVVNTAMFALARSNFTVLSAAAMTTFALIAFALLAAVLSRYIAKAAALQEESEGTL